MCAWQERPGRDAESLKLCTLALQKRPPSHSSFRVCGSDYIITQTREFCEEEGATTDHTGRKGTMWTVPGREGRLVALAVGQGVPSSPTAGSAEVA